MIFSHLGGHRRLGSLVLSAAAALVVTIGVARQPLPVRAQAAPAIAFSLNDGSVAGPDTIAPGTQTLRIANAGTMPHDLHIMRLNDGVTLDQLLAAAPQGNNPDPQSILAFYALAQQFGGVDTLDPGMSQLVTTDFPAGNYIAVDESGDMPLLKSFTVSGTPVDTRVQQADFVVAEGEFFFGAPQTVKAGTNVVKVTNVGYQVHMMVVARLDPGYTIQDVLNTVSTDTNGEPPAFVHPVPGMPDLSPGRTVYTTINLEPGNYVLVCFDPDPVTGQPHVAIGMTASFTAQ